MLCILGNCVTPARLQVGCDFLADIHGDEEIEYNFLAGNEGIPAWDDRLKGLQDEFCRAFLHTSPDFQLGWVPALWCSFISVTPTSCSDAHIRCLHAQCLLDSRALQKQLCGCHCVSLYCLDDQADLLKVWDEWLQEWLWRGPSRAGESGDLFWGSWAAVQMPRLHPGDALQGHPLREGARPELVP